VNDMTAKPISRAKNLPNIWEVAVDVGNFISMALPERPTIISPWLRKSSLAMIYAERGIGKTWLGLSIALSITTTAPIGNWQVSEPVGVLYIDGEMAADEMQKRVRQLSSTLPPILAPFKILSSDLLHQNDYASINIINRAWRDMIFNALSTQTNIGVLVLDNLSCLTPGIEENDKEAWDAINQWLLQLRFLGMAVIFLHHAGKGGKQRGTSGREDALDIVIKLVQPPNHNPSNGAKFAVTFEKSRGVYGDGIADFTFSLGQDENGNMVWLTNGISPKDNKGLIIAMLGEGNMSKEIEAKVGVSKQLVSKHKIWAVNKGYLSEDDKTGQITFTDRGREEYALHLTNQ